MDVQVDSGITRGMSVVDRLGVAADGRNRAVWNEVINQGRKQRVVWEMDNVGWKRLCCERALGCDERYFRHRPSPG